MFLHQYRFRCSVRSDIRQVFDCVEGEIVITARIQDGFQVEFLSED